MQKFVSVQKDALAKYRKKYLKKDVPLLVVEELLEKLVKHFPTWDWRVYDADVWDKELTRRIPAYKAKRALASGNLIGLIFLHLNYSINHFFTTHKTPPPKVHGALHSLSFFLFSSRLFSFLFTVALSIFSCHSLDLLDHPFFPPIILT